MTDMTPRCPNPFTCDSDTLCALLVSQLEQAMPGSFRDVFAGRMVSLIHITTPVLVWVRDNRGVPIHMPQIRCATELHSIRLLANRRLFRLRDWLSCAGGELPVPDMPEALVFPFRAYLGELPGAVEDAPPSLQCSAAEQHAYALSFFVRASSGDAVAAV